MSNGEASTSVGKWQERFGRPAPSVVAAHRALRRRLRAVRTLLAAIDAAGASGVDETHQLRVATRRTSAALKTFRQFLPAKRSALLKERLREIRRSAADVRRADVQKHALEADTPFRARVEYCREAILAYLAETRKSAETRLLELAASGRRRKLDAVARKLLRGLADPKPLQPNDPRSDLYTLGDLVDRMLPGVVHSLTQIQSTDLRSLEAVHQVRLAVKRLRYTLELFAGALPVQAWTDLRKSVEDLQEQLGALNDAHERWLLLSHLSDSGVASADVAHECLAERDRDFERFLSWWSGAEGGELIERLQALLPAPAPEPSPKTETPTRPERPHRRVAALDVGTNSVRLVVAETDPGRGFRVIADVKETTRLGGGMFQDGMLSGQAMQRTVAALGRLRTIAEGHQVEVLRAIGTAAVREARNGDEFLELAEREAGVEIKVVDSDHEARLAFASVASSINLGRRRVAVVDIGGGSTEVVFSAGGLIDSVAPIQIGAVRLTERFAHLTDLEEQFVLMRNFADELILEALPGRPYPVDAIIGCGGTFNNLARLAARNGAPAVGGGRFQSALSGSELPRAEVTRILDWLRRLPIAERRSIAGLSADRSEIIVAGVCIVERLMDRLGVERLQVHGGGVRDGLLIETIDELGLEAAAPPARRPQDLVAAAQSLLEALPVDRPHAEQVARLSLHLFDQLAAQTPDASGSWASAEARLLLEIGALLHDCGAAICYRRHHRHGFDIVHHADLTSLSRREREIVALLARYHRRRGPRTGDAVLKPLSVGDQRLVAHLVGILRIADGLDHRHIQEVSGLRIDKKPNRILIEALAGDKPTRALTAARKKSDFFEQAFRAKVDVVWKAPVPVRTEIAVAGAVS